MQILNQTEMKATKATYLKMQWGGKRRGRVSLPPAIPARIRSFKQMYGVCKSVLLETAEKKPEKHGLKYFCSVYKYL